MDTVTIIFKFLSCPSTNLEDELERMDYSWRNYELLRKVTTNQDQFCDQYNLDFDPLVPIITEYSQIDEFQTDHKVWQVRDRYFYFNYGIVFWEVTFNTDLPKTLPRHFLDYIKIKGKTLLSNAIYRKTRLCTGVKDDKSRCNTCNLSNTYDDATIISTTKSEIYNQVKNYGEAQSKYEVFNLRNVLWVIRKRNQVILTKLDSINSVSPIRDTIILGSLLPLSIKYSGDEVLTWYKEKLPPFQNPVNLEEAIETYIVKFLHRFFFTAPQFLLEKANLRLHLPSLFLKTLTYAYRELVNFDKWQPSSEYLAQVPSHLLVIYRLYTTIRSVPHELLENWSKLLNPFNSALPIKYQNLHKKLDKDQIRIVFIMTKALFKSNKINEIRPLYQQSKLEPFTTSQLTESLGYPRGRKNDDIQGKINQLVKLSILIESTPKKLGISRGPAKHLYYLNPQMTYTQFCFELTQLLPTKEIENLITHIK